MALRNIVKEYRLLINNGQRALSSKVVSEDRSDLTKRTHTGQVFEKDDYRNVRFTNAARYVNENWGIKLIDEIPPKEVTERVVWCDGGDEHLGHPKVYINLDKPGAHTCGYCGLRFIKKDTHH
ncbi:NADH dehydrogenase [ubiquinone] iron-sulfur protein 6, mitochondrial [Condylostylus longicornis]|uniref:NADH dehydrogenase [ubiquinone] iron-sulfur protein 6, mitochondrial n=1 Tax=Condylostylus longicornis TaxID=2530218 RepID=UPI00244E52B9|nr:NADH dehydrogenase [ubiquinone] iron-sulfur protein 6, mitochondrial [Condylostylus longicornis]